MSPHLLPLRVSLTHSNTRRPSLCQIEGWKRRKYWTWSVLDGSGGLLVRLSSFAAADGESWVAALQQAIAACQAGSSLLSGSDAGAGRVHNAEDGFFGPHPPPPPLAAAAKLPLMKSASTRVREAAAKDAAAAAATAAAHGHERHAHAAHHHTRGTGAATGGLRGSTPVHREPRFSPLSSERLLYSSHAGLVNLLFIILSVNHARLILENLGRYGVRVRAGFWVTALGLRDTPRAVPMALAFLALSLFILAANGIERVAYTANAWLLRRRAANHPGRRRVRALERCVFLAHFANTSAVILMPWAVVHVTMAEPLPGFILMASALVLWMKLISYGHANADLRARWRDAALAKKTDDGHHQAAQLDDAAAHTPPGASGEAGPPLGAASGVPGPPVAVAPGEDHSEEYVYAIPYPANLSLGNLSYFVAAPTLCYQPSYPRSERFRGRWLIHRVGELLLFGGLMALIIEQYMMPALTNTAWALLQSQNKQLEPLKLMERLLKLSIPTLYVWLCSFYCLFHCWLNILGELLRFGDRQFYREWWNATTIEQYWRLWNLPVHKWLARHVYFPAMRAGCSRSAAMLITFVFSAVAHELVVGVPCHVLRLWAFAGIVAQLPLISFTNWTSKRLKNDQLGNIVFWLSFCIFGQPMAVVLYFRAYITVVVPAKQAAAAAAAAALAR